MTTVEPDGFWDRNHRFAYLVACENAGRILADPAIIADALAHLQRFAAHDPRQAKGYIFWADLLTRPAPEIAARLVERSELGDYARETAPAFGSLSPKVRARLVREAHVPLRTSTEP